MDTTSSTTEARAGWIVFLLGILILIPSIWRETSVTGGDEYMFTLRTPMEMIEQRDLVTPWLNEEPRLRKPPLVYWAIYGSYKIFGINVFAGRLIGVLAGSALAASAALLARELFGKHALLAGTMALATIGLASEGRRAMLDVPVAAFSAFSVLFFVRWIKTFALHRIVIAAALLGLGVLTKGPVALLFGGAGAITAFFIFRHEINWRRALPHFLVGLLVFAIVALPWPLTMYARWGEKLTAIMKEEFAERQFSGAVRAGSPISAWAGALGLVFPWTFLVLAAIWSRFRNKTGEHRPELLWLIVWCALSALPFFFMKAFERYMLALVPAQAALAAMWLTTAPPKIRRTLLLISLGLLAVVAILVSAFALWFNLAKIWPLISAALAVAIVIGAARNIAPERLALSAAILFTSVFGFIYPTLGIGALPAELPSELRQYRAMRFDTAQPAMLSSRLGYSVQQLTAERFHNRKALDPIVVFLELPALHDFQKFAESNKCATRQLSSYRTFYSRKSWLRFARADATSADWREAFQSRSLDRLRSTFHIILLTPQ